MAHKILTIAYHVMATHDAVYRDLGSHGFARHDNPDRRKDRLVQQLQALGYQVDLTPAA